MTKGKVCSECGKIRERCRACTITKEGDTIWICRQCWNTFDYDSFMYKHREIKPNHA